MTLKHGYIVKRLMVYFFGASVKQRNRISKKSLAKNVTQLMVDLKPELLKKTAVRL